MSTTFSIEPKRQWFRQIISTPKRIHWIFLALITFAELVTSAYNLALGLASHTVLIFLLVVYSALGRQSAERRLALALTLAPLIRLLSLALPLINLPRLSWYPVVAVPLMSAAWLIVRQLRLPAAELGLRRGRVWLQLMLMGGGLGLGWLEYSILRPEPLLATFTWSAFTIAALTLIIATGLVEEIIFRGVLQAVALPALGRHALLYVSLLFAALHIGYLSAVDVLFVFAVGLLFAYIVKWSGSILGVSLAHGLTNVTLFLIMPTLAQQPAEIAALAPWVIWGGSALAMIAVDILLLRAMIRTASTLNQEIAPETNLRDLRRSAGLTYTDLAQRTGLPVRLLAEIEHGLCIPQAEQLAQIAQCLSVAPQNLSAAAT